MGKYIYKLLGYHAVKEAEIKLDGITVLSGINGSLTDVERVPCPDGCII